MAVPDLTPKNVFFYFCFGVLNVGTFVYGWYKQQSDDRLALLNKLEYSVWMSRAAGLCLSINTTIILLPMCKTLSRLLRPKVNFIPLEESTWFHRQIAYTILFWTVMHVLSHYVNFFSIEVQQLRPEKAIQIHYTQTGGITGHIMLLCMMLIYTSAHKKFRLKAYDTFQYTHYLAAPMLIALYCHGTGCFVRDSVEPVSPFAGAEFWRHCIGYQSWRWELFGLALYLVDRIYRAIRVRGETELVHVIRHPSKIIELRFKKAGFNFKAGQWLLIKIPVINRSQWHPFTISSASFEEFVSVHIKESGDWTTALLDLFVDEHNPTSASSNNEILEWIAGRVLKLPKIYVDGPFGAPATVQDAENAVLIGTGIGATPWMSILQELWHQQARPRPNLATKQIDFIWICPTKASLELLEKLLNSLRNLEKCMTSKAKNAGPQLRIHMYITRGSPSAFVPTTLTEASNISSTIEDSNAGSESRTSLLHSFRASNTYPTRDITEERGEPSFLEPLSFRSSDITLNLDSNDTSLNPDIRLSSSRRPDREVQVLRDDTSRIQYDIHYKRPDFKAILEEIRVRHPEGVYISEPHIRKDVPVYFCGAAKIGKDIEHATESCSNQGLRFTYHREDM